MSDTEREWDSIWTQSSNCSCHKEGGSHELCCGHENGRDPDCPFHGDGTKGN